LPITFINGGLGGGIGGALVGYGGNDIVHGDLSAGLMLLF